MKNKKSCLLLVSAFLAALCASRIESAEAPPPARPQVARAERHDVSPALRHMPPIEPPAAPVFREIPRQPLPRRGPPPRVPDPVIQKSHGVINMPAPINSFGGSDNTDNVLPPDTNGDVGPNHYVQWVNLHFIIYDKAGVKLYGPAAGNTLWSGFGGPCETTNNGDPIALYDHLADRWLMSQLALPNFPNGPYYQCIAVSKTSDPAGQYYRYAFKISDTKLNDYPKFGVWPDGYYMSVNQFECTFFCLFGIPDFTWAGQGVVAFERDKMLNGLPASMVYFDLFSVDPNLGGMLPSDLDGPPPSAGSPNYFVQVDDDAWGYSPDQLQIWQFSVNWTTPASSTFTKNGALATAPFDSNMCGYTPCIPQPGTNVKLDAISDRLMYRLQYRKFGTHESLVTNHTVDVGFDHAGIRWYELRNSGAGWVIHQQGSYGPDSNHRWMGSVAMDGQGNIGLGFSVSSSATYPSIRYVGRLASDPLGDMSQAEAELIAGSGSQTHSSGRWGDYSMMAVDPTDNCAFWYTQEYYQTTSSIGWKTRIGSFEFPSCGGGPQLPTVTISATDATASEAGLNTGAFTVSRTGSTVSDLTVNYTVGGTAASGLDYNPLLGSITIPAGSSTATITVSPVDDTLVEGNETVIVTLASNAAYNVGSPNSATVTISDNDASITVTSPNGGEVWRANSKKTIQWSSTGVSGNVKIELSRNGGSSWEIVFSSTGNDGSESWKVTGPSTNQARVRICSVSNPTVCDTSNANFTIK